MNKNVIIIALSAIVLVLVSFIIGFLVADGDLDFSFSSNKNEVKTTTTLNTKGKNINEPKSKKKMQLFGPKVNITKSKAKMVEYQNYDNGLFSMKIPKGWMVGIGKSDYTHYTFMVYNPANPDYKIFFNMKTEGYFKTQQMKNFFARNYPTSPLARMAVIDPQTTDAFYKTFTQAYSVNQNVLPFKVPVIKNFKTVQTLGKSITGGTIVRGVYQNEQGKNAEGIFTATIKEFPVPPIVLLSVYNTVFFTTPENELVDWMSVLNYCVSTINFSENFMSGFYREQGQNLATAKQVQSICNQTSDIITSGWNERQKTYDTLSQKRSDATMGYERVQDTDTGEIYKATVGFTDHDWHGKYVPITDDMYNLPTAGYIEKW